MDVELQCLHLKLYDLINQRYCHKKEKIRKKQTKNTSRQKLKRLNVMILALGRGRQAR